MIVAIGELGRILIAGEVCVVWKKSTDRWANENTAGHHVQTAETTTGYK
jgi:hypothetical protein